MKIPNQRLPRKKKTDEWGKLTVDAIIDKCTFHTVNGELNDLLAAYEGELRNVYYSHVINPYNTQNEKYKRYPAKLRSYNIIKPIVDLYVGERSLRPFLFSVGIKNADATNQMIEAYTGQMRDILSQMLVNELNEMGVETGVESQPTPQPQDVPASFNANYKDARAIQGQEALNIMKEELDLIDRFQDAFFSWLVYGRVITYKGVVNDDLEYEIVSPYDVDFSVSERTRFLEDADWVVARRRMTISEMIDSFHDVLTDEQIDHISDDMGLRSFSLVEMVQGRPAVADIDRQMYVYHVTWKSLKKIGFVAYVDELGMEQEEIVDETYVPMKGEKVEWRWINEWWEGYKTEDDMYFRIQPIAHQRRDMSNPSKCKGVYNGRIDNLSVVKVGLPYQILYNIIHYRLELSIARNKDKIMLAEINTVPRRHGWDEEKFMYYANADGTMWIDSTATGKNNERVTFNQFQVLDMSLGQYIAAQFEILTAIKQEWEETIGVNRFRKGQSMASDAVGMTERAVFQSGVITEEMFRKFDRFCEKELLGLLDNSKLAWQKGKKSSYTMSDMREVLAEIDGEMHASSEYGVYVASGSKEKEKLDTLRGFAQAFAQNGVGPGAIAEILDSENFTGIKMMLKDLEQKMERMQEEQRKHELQMVQAQNEAELEKQARDHENKKELKDMDTDSKLLMGDLDKDGIKDQAETEALRRKMDLEERKVNIEERQGDRKLDIEADKVKTQKSASKKST